MADVQPFRAVRYDSRVAGRLDDLVAPPYDVIDEPRRAQLAARSPFNVVELDLPRANGGDPYLSAQTTWEAWLQQGVLTREREPAIWLLRQDYELGGQRFSRHGFFARVRVEEYGQGRVRPHERTHPGPKEDRLRLMLATRANLSPVFSLFPDHDEAAWSALAPVTEAEPFASLADADGVTDTLWRIADADAIAAVQAALAERELLIADGHHRYETARVYADQIRGEGEHRFVLMLLVSLTDPGLAILPTHRLLTALDDGRRTALRHAMERDFDVHEATSGDPVPPASERPAFGFVDAAERRPLWLTLRGEPRIPGRPEAYARLDTAVLEELVLHRALGMSDDDISHLNGLAYSNDAADAQRALDDGRAEAVFFMRATPIEQVREVAAAGETMPPKSTFFYPKVPTGLLFNPLE